MRAIESLRKQLTNIVSKSLGVNIYYNKVFGSQIFLTSQEIEFLKLIPYTLEQTDLQDANGNPVFMWGVDGFGDAPLS